MCRVDYANEEGAWIIEPHHEAEVNETFTCCECERPIEPMTAITNRRFLTTGTRPMLSRGTHNAQGQSTETGSPTGS